MKRKAVLICNNDASGAHHDIEKWRQFLMSGEGGAWIRTEISFMVNPSKKEVCSKISEIRNNQYDFVFVAYAGHGIWHRTTNIELNSNGEIITEDCFLNLAQRQIVCFDCCRGINHLNEDVSDILLRHTYSENQMECIRVFYDMRMMNAQPQIVKLYACHIGESAYCNDDGGYYTNNLICYAEDFLPNNMFQTINRAHNLAAYYTSNQVESDFGISQKPEFAGCRCCSASQLIIGINPKMLI